MGPVASMRVACGHGGGFGAGLAQRPGARGLASGAFIGAEREAIQAPDASRGAPRGSGSRQQHHKAPQRLPSPVIV